MQIALENRSYTSTKNSKLFSKNRDSTEYEKNQFSTTKLVKHLQTLIFLGSALTTNPKRTMDPDTTKQGMNIKIIKDESIKIFYSLEKT